MRSASELRPAALTSYPDSPEGKISEDVSMILLERSFLQQFVCGSIVKSRRGKAAYGLHSKHFSSRSPWSMSINATFRKAALSLTARPTSWRWLTWIDLASSHLSLNNESERYTILGLSFGIHQPPGSGLVSNLWKHRPHLLSSLAPASRQIRKMPSRPTESLHQKQEPPGKA